MPIRSAAWPPGTPCWVDCQVDDPAAAGTFYAGLFGWDVQGADQEPGGYLMALREGRAVAGIGPTPESGMPAAWTTYFAVESADATAERVREAGGTLLLPPFDVLDSGRMFVAVDVTGAPFAVWEARAHNGAAVHNEHGAYLWNDLHTGAYEAAKRFYADVFGFAYTEYDNEVMRYAVFAPPGRAEGTGGISDASRDGDAPARPYWLTWFRYDGIDEGVARAEELGAIVLLAPADGPFGRMAILAAPQGELFALSDPSRAVGELPDPIG
ncbi:VOC family protein [Nocardia otitidiscaviarum]|uniref:VOC family protein n=1 Tax=Nocardia otitidiscaviarum TaxID=1823 RepID=A0A516NFA7_9NOCA|nr:VOC family protein [Nocardia otitidiscaviarum]MCP9622879.1 VOC family protein [Nocardia otitidiscaviarum]QDP77571.1 VOC family protein [Nocardia otitidiscaviarum]